jgi:hypothetical protein
MRKTLLAFLAIGAFALSGCQKNNLKSENHPYQPKITTDKEFYAWQDSIYKINLIKRSEFSTEGFYKFEK